MTSEILEKEWDHGDRVAFWTFNQAIVLRNAVGTINVAI